MLEKRKGDTPKGEHNETGNQQKNNESPGENRKEKSSVLEERGGIERRWSDEQDFPEIAIWSIEEMLIAAYNLGRKDAKEGK